MATVTGNFPGRPFRLRCVTTLVRQEVSNNRSLLHTELWIDKLSYSPTWSGQGQANRIIYWNGSTKESENGTGFDFQGSGPWKILTYEAWVSHSSDGSKSLTAQGRANYDQLGAVNTAIDDIDLPDIPRDPPPAPSNVGLDQITRNSIRYRFSSNGSGDTPITKWQYQVSRNSDMSSSRLVDTSGGTNVVENLQPGTLYYFRSRGVNSIGPGNWSSKISARTLSGAYISTGSAWVPAEVLISDGKKWLATDVVISDGKTWKPTA